MLLLKRYQQNSQLVLATTGMNGLRKILRFPQGLLNSILKVNLDLNIKSFLGVEVNLN